MLQVLGFVVLFAGTSIYNELIRTWLPESFSRASSMNDLQVRKPCLSYIRHSFSFPRGSRRIMLGCQPNSFLIDWTADMTAHSWNNPLTEEYIPGSRPLTC